MAGSVLLQLVLSFWGWQGLLAGWVLSQWWRAPPLSQTAASVPRWAQPSPAPEGLSGAEEQWPAWAPPLLPWAGGAVTPAVASARLGGNPAPVQLPQGLWCRGPGVHLCPPRLRGPLGRKGAREGSASRGRAEAMRGWIPVVRLRGLDGCVRFLRPL